MTMTARWLGTRTFPRPSRTPGRGAPSPPSRARSASACGTWPSSGTSSSSCWACWPWPWGCGGCWPRARCGGSGWPRWAPTPCCSSCWRGWGPAPSPWPAAWAPSAPAPACCASSWGPCSPSGGWRCWGGCCCWRHDTGCGTPCGTPCSSASCATRRSPTCGSWWTRCSGACGAAASAPTATGRPTRISTAVPRERRRAASPPPAAWTPGRTAPSPTPSAPLGSCAWGTWRPAPSCTWGVAWHSSAPGSAARRAASWPARPCWCWLRPPACSWR
ncbi:hypothetical protein QYF61_026902 [Mycteria americana]|uniref:Uncharacterized protein n=1 Tax=Mycteria americana TaxID=33587 RepID=A0AAN7MRH9_MYCAM|nr:hypothetical protein QYF61_026902 [Mycteria americana]